MSDVIKPLNIEALFDQEVQNLSGGELQRVAITLCLGTPADIYLVDEPSAYLDSEQRIIAAKVSTAASLSPNRLCSIWAALARSLWLDPGMAINMAAKGDSASDDSRLPMCRSSSGSLCTARRQPLLLSMTS